MTERTVFERAAEVARCGFAWCVTEHGDTVHPADEDHRSVGRGWPGRVRGGRGVGPGVETDIELGVLRREGDSHTWVVIDAGAGLSIALSPEAAFALGRRLVDDPDVRAARSSGG